MAFRDSLRSLRRDENGTAAIEFAAIASFLVLVLVGVTDVSRLALSSMRVRYAAEAGATYAAMHGLPGTGAIDPNIVKAAGSATALNCSAQTSESDSQCVSTARAYYGCATNSGVNEVANYPQSSAPKCNTSASGTSIDAGLYVSVISQVSFQPYFQPVFLVYPQMISHKLDVRIK
jgi:Flp pilus assembly protein TadG